MKYKELISQSEAEVKKLLGELESKVYDLSLKSRLKQLKNHSELRAVRKDVARILTFLSSK